MDTSGLIHDPIQNVAGGDLDYSGFDLALSVYLPDADLSSADLSYANLFYAALNGAT